MEYGLVHTPFTSWIFKNALQHGFLETYVIQDDR